jgi:hypothetical protein
MVRSYVAAPADSQGALQRCRTLGSVGVSLEELQLAARNHGMPLEALRYDVTPVGLHYLLTHFDVPEAPADWRLEVGGLVARPLSLPLEALQARPFVQLRVTMECAGNGRVRLEPHVVGQPWLAEAIGTAEWAARRSGRFSKRPASRTAPSRSFSPGSTAVSRAGSSTTTSGA